MTQLKLDMRRRPCPEPVVETLKALEDSRVDNVEVLVDNDGAAENVARSGRSQGCEVSVESEITGELRVRLVRKSNKEKKETPATPADADACCENDDPDLVVLVPTDAFGQGDPDLGRPLLLAFINTLGEIRPRPKKLILVNNGAKLACGASEFVKPLKALEEKGVTVMVCGTCLDFYNLEKSLKVGRISNMFEIADTLANADKIMRP